MTADRANPDRRAGPLKRVDWAALPGRLWSRFFEDRLTTAASSVAFYLMLASIPGVAAVVSLYGVLANPHDTAALATAVSSLLPQDVAELFERQVMRLIGDQGGRATSITGSLAWFLLVLWSANRGTRGFVEAFNVIYDEAEERGFFQRLVVTLALTLGAVVFLVCAIFGIVVLPVILSLIGLEDTKVRTLGLLRWPVLMAIAAGAMMVLYRVGPSRVDWRWPTLLLGSAAGAVLWISFSALFSWYVQSFGSFAVLYGSLGAVIGFMMWLWLSALAVLIGAEIDAGAARVFAASERAAHGSRRARGMPASDHTKRHTQLPPGHP